MLTLQDYIMTVNAANCQTKNAQIIVEQGGGYVLSLKENYPALRAEAQKAFESEAQTDFHHVRYSAFETVERGHGQSEMRHYMLIDDSAYIAYLNPDDRWAGLDSLRRVERERKRGDKAERNTAYYISRLTGSAEQIAHTIRSHWEVKNALHWRLTLPFVRISRARVCATRLKNSPFFVTSPSSLTKPGIWASSPVFAGGRDVGYLLHPVAGNLKN